MPSPPTDGTDNDGPIRIIEEGPPTEEDLGALLECMRERGCEQRAIERLDAANPGGIELGDLLDIMTEARGRQG